MIFARRSLRVFLVASIAAIIFGIPTTKVTAQTPTPYPSYNSGDFFLPPYLSDSERMGYGKSSAHDTTPLNAGWYLDWGAASPPAHPNGAEYGRTIYLNVHHNSTDDRCAESYIATQLTQITPSITGTTLIQRVQAEPGALWMVGNEPDSIYNGSPIQAELYAELYHYFYTTIKTADPAAKIAIGAIVQPSPLRMEYLDKVLAQYQTLYGEPMPVDVWNIHFYRLNEGACGATWGATVPPFSSSNNGWNIAFTANDLLNIDALQLALRDFRQWMANRGYKDVPLIITEMGVLPPPNYSGFDNNTTAQFLGDVFDMLLTVTDTNTGLAADGNRLMQAWAWYSTHDSVFGYGGNLFNTDGSLTVIGDTFAAQTAAHFTPYVDLQLVPPENVFTDTTSLNLFSYIQNQGNITATDTIAEISLQEASESKPAFTHTIELGAYPSRYAIPPTLINHTWEITYTQLPTETVPYTVSIDVVSSGSDASLDDNHQNFATNWWPIRDLAIDLTISNDKIQLYDLPVTLVATSTVKNIGQYATIATDAEISLTTLHGSAVFPQKQTIIPPLNIGEQYVFTTAFSVTEAGRYTATAQFLHPLGLPELSGNNIANKPYAVICSIYLPLILR